jgi:transcriptional regulator with XRE-family HTH domain
MVIPQGKLGPVLKAVRKHRNERQPAVAARAGVDRARVAQVELGLNLATKVVVRRWIAAGWCVSEDTINAVADGVATTGLAADAFGVPEEVLTEALRGSADLATEAS